MRAHRTVTLHAAAAACAFLGMLVLSLPAAGDDVCGTALPMHTDGSYEYAYIWSDTPPQPDFGAFADVFSGSGEVCAIVVMLTQGPEYATGPSDVFLWSDAGGEPGVLLAAKYHAWVPGELWPHFWRHSILFSEPVCVQGTFWVGWRAAWGFNPLIGADLDGPGGGRPMTKVPPGAGYPTGWQDVSLVFGPTQGLAISAEIRECPVTPVAERSWGRIKALYGGSTPSHRH